MKVLWGLMFNYTEHGAPPFPLCRGCYKHRLWSMSEVQWIFVKSVKCCDPGVKPALVWTSDSKSLTAASMFSVQSLPPTGCTVLSTFPKHFLHLQKTKEKNWEYTQRAALLHMFLVLLSFISTFSVLLLKNGVVWRTEVKEVWRSASFVRPPGGVNGQSVCGLWCRDKISSWVGFTLSLLSVFAAAARPLTTNCLCVVGRTTLTSDVRTKYERDGWFLHGGSVRERQSGSSSVWTFWSEPFVFFFFL